MEILFWISAALFGLNYFIYPFAVILISRLVHDSHNDIVAPESYCPRVSLIIAAYNESSVIRRKIENSLQLDYPKEKLEVIVVSDGSDDETYEIAKEFDDQGVVAMHRPERQGKSAAINRAVNAACGEILLLSDANNDFSTDAVRLLVRHFYDKVVGGVSGAKRVYNDADREATRGDSAYWKYESAIKLAESRLGSITSADGEIFAIRASLFSPIGKGLINDDAALTFGLVRKHHRVLYETEAKSFEKASSDLVDDFNVKVRMAAGGFQSIVTERSLLFPPTSWFAISFLLHKVLRWLAPLFLIVMFFSSFLLGGNLFYLLLFLGQCVFYLLSFLGWKSSKKDLLPGIVYTCMYFSIMNLALLFGLFRFLKGGQSVQWAKAER